MNNLKKKKFNLLINKFKKLDSNLNLKEDYIELVRNIENYKSVCIFIDNSGFDVVLGVMPLVIEFLKNSNTKVLLCANTKPAINDITYAELLLVIKKACALNETLKHAFYVSKHLIIMETGSSSPCLDLSRINVDLAKLIVANRVDLVIIEGMGRAIHTNFYAKFKCDCLKVAVLKNQWLAERFGFNNSINNSSNESKFPIIKKYL